MQISGLLENRNLSFEIPWKFRENFVQNSHSTVYLVFWKMAEQRKEGEDGQLLMREGIHELSESQEKQHHRTVN